MPDDRSPHRAALRTLARPETPLFLATIALLLYLGNGTLYEVGSTAVTNSKQEKTNNRKKLIMNHSERKRRPHVTRAEPYCLFL